MDHELIEWAFTPLWGIHRMEACTHIHTDLLVIAYVSMWCRFNQCTLSAISRFNCSRQPIHVLWSIIGFSGTHDEIEYGCWRHGIIIKWQNNMFYTSWKRDTPLMWWQSKALLWVVLFRLQSWKHRIRLKRLRKLQEIYRSIILLSKYAFLF